MPAKIKITKEFLVKQHLELNKTVPDISREFGFCSSSIKDALYRYKLKYKKAKKGSPKKDRTGMIYGSYTVVSLIKQEANNTYWLCKCKCGAEKILETRSLNRHISKKFKFYGCMNCRVKKVGEITQVYLNVIKKCAKHRNIEYNVTDEYLWSLFLKQNRKCALTDLDITFSNVYYRDFDNQTASLDRIDSSKGYVEGNLQWVHKKINTIKMDLSQKDFIELCRLVTVKYMK